MILIVHSNRYHGLKGDNIVEVLSILYGILLLGLYEKTMQSKNHYSIITANAA